MIATISPATNTGNFLCPNSETEYRATGFIRGRYVPGKDWVGRGVITSETQSIPANLTQQLVLAFQKNPLLIEQEYLWSTWIRTDKQGEPRLTLKHFLTSSVMGEEKINELNQLSNCFSIRGELYSWNQNTDKEKRGGIQSPPDSLPPQPSSLNSESEVSQNFKILIKRNTSPPDNIKSEKKWLYSPFKLQIVGTLPEKPKKGQFWGISCQIEQGRLILKEAILIKQPVKPKKPIKKPRPKAESKPIKPVSKEVAQKPVKRFPVKPLGSDGANNSTKKNQTRTIPQKPTKQVLHRPKRYPH